MRAANLGKLIGDWLFQASGYDANNVRFTDRSGLGNHMVKIAGSTAFDTRDSIPGVRLHQGAYFQCPNFLAMKHTIIVVSHLELTGAEEAMLFGTVTSGDAANDRYQLRASNTTLNLGSFTQTGGTFPAATFTSGAWRVFQGVQDPIGGLVKARVDKGAIDAAAVTDGFRASTFGDRARLGNATTITTAGGKHVTTSRAMVFNGDLFANNLTMLDNYIDDLLVNPAL